MLIYGPGETVVGKIRHEAKAKRVLTTVFCVRVQRTVECRARYNMAPPGGSTPRD